MLTRTWYKLQFDIQKNGFLLIFIFLTFKFPSVKFDPLLLNVNHMRILNFIQ